MNLPADVSPYSMPTSVCGTGVHSKTSSFGVQAATLLWFEYVQPPTKGGASMWPIAQLVGGTIAAFVGAFAAWAVLEIRNRHSQKRH